jgi:patatin-like phospholipase/acyl hydrolase
MWDDKYSVKNLEQVLFNYFKFTRLSQLTSSCVITAYDVQERKAHFFTKHNAFKAHKDFYVKDICRASSAAPSYFEVARIKSMANKNFHFIDGGVFANNPALCAYAEARTLDFDKYRKRPTAKDLLIFSIGSGKIIDSFHFKKTRNLGAIGWAKYIIDIMMGGTSNVVDYELRQIFDAVESLHHYFRLEPELFQASNDLDDASAKNIKALRDAGHQNALMHDEKLEQIAKLLIENE